MPFNVSKYCCFSSCVRSSNSDTAVEQMPAATTEDVDLYDGASSVSTDSESSGSESGAAPVAALNQQQLSQILFQANEQKAQSLREGNIGIIASFNKDNINARIEGDLSAMHIIAISGQKDLGEALMVYNPNLEVEDDFVFTPLHFAAMEGQVDVVTWLCENGVIIEARNEEGTTPLYAAVNRNQAAAVDELLFQGANPDIAQEDGRTPLHCAVIEYIEREECRELVAKEEETDYVEDEDGTGLTVIKALLAHDADVDLEFTQEPVYTAMSAKKIALDPDLQLEKLKKLFQ